MTKYLISFPSFAMVIPEGEFEQIAEDARTVIEEAKAAGVYVFAGGIDESVPAALVSADGAVETGIHPGAEVPNGGYTVLDLPTRESAVEWAARIARACRCAQELREFQDDERS